MSIPDNTPTRKKQATRKTAAEQALLISDLRMDGGTQPRGEINAEVVAEYAEVMQEGATFPPVVVFHDGETYWLADGFHRVRAAQKLGWLDIPAELHQGTQADAQWHSYSVNQTHGLRRSNEDKRRAVEAALRHPAAEGKSNEAIAEHCGVSSMTVGKYRRSSEPTLKNLESPVIRTGKDGRAINTGKIGKKASDPPAPAPAPTLKPPSWSRDDLPPPPVTKGDGEVPVIPTREAAPPSRRLVIEDDDDELVSSEVSLSEHERRFLDILRADVISENPELDEAQWARIVECIFARIELMLEEYEIIPRDGTGNNEQ